MPLGFPGAGSLKLASYPDGEWYDAGVAPDGSGTYDLTGLAQVTGSTVPGGPEGLVYVGAGSPGFPSPGLLVAEFDGNRVSAYDVDADGNPAPATRRTFVSGLTGAEGAFIDPLTGDFLFSTFGLFGRVIVVRGFNRPPGTLTVVKHVVNGDGGSAAASAWTMHVKAGAPPAEVAGSPFAGAEAPGVTRTLPAGAYVVSESGGPGGFATSFSGDCDAAGRVTLAPGESRTCTVTSDDVPSAPPPPPPPPPPEFSPLPPPPSDEIGNTVVGYWKVPGSERSVVFRVTRLGAVGGQPPAPIFGFSPDKVGRTFRPAGCYTRVGQLSWALGFGGGGKFRRFEPGTGCRRQQMVTTRWFLNGPNGLYNNFVVDPDGLAGPAPGRQHRMFWERTRPVLVLEAPTYSVAARRFTVSFRTFAHYEHVVRLIRDRKVVDAQRVPMRDGRWTVRLAAPLRADKYRLVLSAMRSTQRVEQVRTFSLTTKGKVQR